MYSNRTFKCNSFCTIPLGICRRLSLHEKHILILQPGKPSCTSACMCLARWLLPGYLNNCALLLNYVHPCSHNFFNQFNSTLPVFLSLQLQTQQEWSQWAPLALLPFKLFVVKQLSQLTGISYSVQWHHLPNSTCTLHYVYIQLYSCM